MKVKIRHTDYIHLEENLNDIGYENILQIIPTNNFDGCIICIIYK